MTRDELSRRLNNDRIPAMMYSLDGGLQEEAYSLAETCSGWEVYYVERGQKTPLGTFGSEEEACSFLYNELKQIATDMGLLEDQ